MKKQSFLFFLMVCFCFYGISQNSEYKLQNYHPVSPSAFQFLKYTELPVSEYSGIPNISIPLYQIEEDGIKIPLNLTYHAGGIRVSQEASWVGLGWDLAVGSIVQEINDRDDYGIGITRLLPDWDGTPVPQLYSRKISNLYSGYLEPGWDNIVPVNAPSREVAYRIYSTYPISIQAPGPYFSDGFVGVPNYYLPLDGNRDNQPEATDLVNNPNYDSEPDIFTANFLGHSIKFIRNSTGTLISVLNKAGYQVTRAGDVYTITVPSGEQFMFDKVTTVNSSSITYGGVGVVGYNSTNVQPSSKIWMLTKIITVNGREIIFNYHESAEIDNFPNYSEKDAKKVTSSSGSLGTGEIEGVVGAPVEGLGRTYSYSKENRLTLTSIIFPKGQVTFTISDRTDMLSAKKLDAIEIKNSENVTINSYQFSYSYFDASGVGGNKFTLENPSLYGNTPDLRLKLLSLQDNSGAIHTFTYDNTPLPSKNSFAQDFWGFYNGQLTNTSLIPNPARFPSPHNLSTYDLGNNGNNNSANLTYIKAGTLTSIKYPTGGSVHFEYELNQFNNYWVPDFSTTTNQSSNGLGLRVSIVTHKSDDNSISKKTTYSYTGGKALQPVRMSRQFGITSLQFNTPPFNGVYGYANGCSVVELNGKGFFSSSSLGSGNRVGYDMVTKRDVDGAGVSLGKTETNFWNTPDKIDENALFGTYISAAMPAIVNTVSPDVYKENGLDKSVLIYDAQDRLIRKIENTHSCGGSLYYGARIFGYTTIYFIAGSNSANYYWYGCPRALVGYYPIIALNSYLQQTKVTEYDDNNNPLERKTLYSYDNFGFVNTKITFTGTQEDIYEKYERAYEYYQRTGNILLYNNHRYADVTKYTTGFYRIQDYGGPHFQVSSETFNDYSSFGSRIGISSVTVKKRDDTSPKIATFDFYDAYGNPLQSTSVGETNSLMWDYIGEYVVAEVQNADYSSIAYTSFETSGKGNWAFNGTTLSVSNAPTGKKAFNLISSSISSPDLSISKIYLVSYWLKNNTGSCLVNGSPGTIKAVKTGWTHYEKELPSGTSFITVSGTGIIDELRLHPKGSLMKTYTYNPLIGISSVCDPNNRISYYEYDAVGRLIIIRDQDRKVIKKICYNYAGQPENCTTQFWTNSQLSQNFTRNNCGAGYIGSTVTYTVPEGTYFSSISQADANQQAQNDITANGQAYANANGSCSCDAATCIGPSQKCIYNVCYTGDLKCVSAVYNSKTGMWTCTYYYVFSVDCSSNFAYTTTSSTSCSVDPPCR